MSQLDFCKTHALLPAVAFTLLAAIFATTRLDAVVAHALFFDDAHMTWRGARSWWVNEFLHTGGRWAVRSLVAAAAAACVASYLDRTLSGLRRPSAYFVLSVLLSMALVGGLKTQTNVDCPWDLTEFGGRFPLVALFADRPDALRYGQCFPAAHAGTGYALTALYFAMRERSMILARAGLAVGMLLGLVFGLAQQARGAHFLSHDLWSAFLTWMTSLAVYVFVFRTRLHDVPSEAVPPASLGRAGQPAPHQHSVADASLCGGYRRATDHTSAR